MRKYRPDRKTTATWYGREGLVRGYCKDCKSTSIILNSHFLCCDGKVPDEKLQIERVKRYGEASTRHIGNALKQKILMAQKYRCYYCGIDLSQIWFYMDKYGDFREVKINFDHFMPKSYASNETFENLYGSCNLCNRFKRNLIFDSIHDARDYIRKKLKEKG